VYVSDNLSYSRSQREREREKELRGEEREKVGRQ
jgi:hypothetical protein